MDIQAKIETLRAELDAARASERAAWEAYQAAETAHNKRVKAEYAANVQPLRLIWHERYTTNNETAASIKTIERFGAE